MTTPTEPEITVPPPTIPYAEIAERYWRTFLPSRYRTLDTTEKRTAFFTSLTAQVVDAVGYLTEDNFRASSRTTDDPLTRQRKLTMAHSRAEQEALGELVYLPKERGTTDRDLPRT